MNDTWLKCKKMTCIYYYLLFIWCLQEIEMIKKELSVEDQNAIDIIQSKIIFNETYLYKKKISKKKIE